MESLFRFMVLRPPEAIDVEKAAIPLNTDSAFQKSIFKYFDGNVDRDKLKKEIEKFFTENSNSDSIHQISSAAAVLKLREKITSTRPDSLSALNEMITAVFQQPADVLVKSDIFITQKKTIADNIVAVKLSSKDRKAPLTKLVSIYQTMHLINLVANKSPVLNSASQIEKILNKPLVLPFDLRKQNVTETVAPPPIQKTQTPIVPQYEKEETKLKAIQKAFNELMSLSTSELEVKENPSESGKSITETKKLDTLQPLSPSELATVLSQAKDSKTIISKKALATIGDDTKALLKQEGIDIDDTDYEMVIMRLKKLSEGTHNKVLELEPVFILPIGSSVDNNNYDYDPNRPIIQEVILPAIAQIKPAGVGDLKLVKQQLVGYEGGDVAHIENVLKGETKVREHRRTKRTEEVFMTELESAAEEEKGLQSTERFEIQREAEDISKKESKIQTGLDTTARYGSILEVNANFALELDKSKEASRKVASEFSKEVINKAVSKVTEKIHEKRMLTTTEEVEEKNTHSLQGTDAHVIGVYQWVDKVYEAQVFNYGKREMYDLLLPEPGSFLWEATKRKAEDELGLVVPIKFNLKPNELDAVNYVRYVKRYKVSGITPPPQEFINVTRPFYGEPKSSEESGNQASAAMFCEAAEIDIGDDYEALEGRAVVSFICDRVNSTKEILQIAIGVYPKEKDSDIRNPFRFFNWIRPTGSETGYDTPRTAKIILHQETGKISVSVLANEAYAYTALIEIKCRRTQRAYKQWQLDTHAAIMQAYLTEKAKVEEKLAAYAIQNGPLIIGKNPEYNQRLIHNELKKACITMLTKQHYDRFNSIEIDPDTHLPRIKLSEARKDEKFIRFFEHAFEWENLSYTLYPYFWGRKTKWQERLIFEDVDPMYMEFIQAGAARVVIPVRNGFGGAIEHYMLTGELWEGGQLPQIGSDLYVPIIEEMMEQLGAPGSEIPEGDPWLVKVPTSLVRLREDGSLPKWRKDNEGNWVTHEGD